MKEIIDYYDSFNAVSARLTHFTPLVYFCTSLKHQKMRKFLIFSGVIERGQWHEMGYVGKT